MGAGELHSGIGLVLILVVAAIVAMAASGLTAVVLERVAYRPLRRRGAGRLSALISATARRCSCRRPSRCGRAATWCPFHG